MPLQFDHLGVVVSDIAAGREHFQSIFGVQSWTKTFADPVNRVSVQFGLDPGGLCYELISPLGPDSPVTRALKARNPILNHIAYLTPDLKEAEGELRKKRFLPTGPANPAVAYGGARIQFFMSPLSFVVELIKSFGHRHDFFPALPVSQGGEKSQTCS